MLPIILNHDMESKKLNTVTHLWISCSHAGQHSRQHLLAFLPRATRHCQFEHVHHNTCIIRHKQAGELIEVLRFWTDHFTLALRVLKVDMDELGAYSQGLTASTRAQLDRLTSLVLVMVSAMMLAAPGSSVTGMKGREEAPEAEGVIADDGVTASSDEGTCSHTETHIWSGHLIRNIRPV